MTAEAYTVTEVCEILGCEAETVTERITNGDLPGLKFGRGWIIPRKAFDQCLNELALQEAQERRAARQAGRAAATAIGAAKKPGAQTAAGRLPARQARKPPTLPTTGRH